MKDVLLMPKVYYIDCVKNLYAIQETDLHSKFGGVHLYDVYAVYQSIECNVGDDANLRA